MTITFADIEQSELSGMGFHSEQSLSPFWVVYNNRSDLGGPEEYKLSILDWKNRAFKFLADYKEPFIRTQRINNALYAGRHYFSQLYKSVNNFRHAHNHRPVDKHNMRITLNFIGQSVRTHVAELSGYEPNVVITPFNTEESDKVAARTVKEVDAHYKRKLKIKERFSKFHTLKKVHGEAFWFVCWDEDAGDFHPAYREIRRLQQESGLPADTLIPVLDENGEQVLGEDNEPLFITEALRIGDLKVELEYSEKVLHPYPDSGEWDDVPWVMRLKFEDVDVVRRKYPFASEDITKTGSLDRLTTWSTYRTRSLHPKVLVRYFYHKPTPEVPDGAYIVSTDNAILRMGSKIANHDSLPCVRGTDRDIPGEITGMSFIQDIASVNSALNDSMGMALSNQALFAYPKILVPKGAQLRSSSMGDERLYVEFDGPQKPELFAPNSTPNDTWRWQEILRGELRSLSDVFGPSRGEPPPGLTANVALRMIEEQERKFRKPDIDKHDQNVIDLTRLMVATLGTYRLPDDGAMIEIVGKHNKRQLRYFDSAHLGKDFIYVIDRTSGLPDSPAARVQTVIDLAGQMPDLFSKEEVLEAIGHPKPDKLIDSATRATQSAESEVEDIFSGFPVDPPKAYHDLLPKYNVYMKAMQTRDFSEMPEIIKQRMIQQVLTCEYLIAKKMQMNPVFAQKVLTEHTYFPLVFMMDDQLAMQEAALAPAQPMGPANAPSFGGVPPQAAGPTQQTIPGPGQIPPDNIPPEGIVPAEGEIPIQ